MKKILDEWAEFFLWVALILLAIFLFDGKPSIWDALRMAIVRWLGA